MTVFIVGVVCAVVGAGCGYGFRGFINRTGKTVASGVSADASKVAASAASVAKKA